MEWSDRVLGLSCLGTAPSNPHSTSSNPQYGRTICLLRKAVVAWEQQDVALNASRAPRNTTKTLTTLILQGHQNFKPLDTLVLRSKCCECCEPKIPFKNNNLNATLTVLRVLHKRCDSPFRFGASRMQTSAHPIAPLRADAMWEFPSSTFAFQAPIPGDAGHHRGQHPTDPLSFLTSHGLSSTDHEGRELLPCLSFPVQLPARGGWRQSLVSRACSSRPGPFRSRKGDGSC